MLLINTAFVDMFVACFRPFLSYENTFAETLKQHHFHPKPLITIT